MKKFETVTSYPLAPDGGWGWVVCGATFVCLAINEGIAFIFGLLYVDLLEYYREDPGLTAMVGSAYLGTHMVVGPVVGAMIKCCGSRVTAMLGGLLAGLAVSLSILSPSMTVMILLFGIAGGTAVGMVFLPAVLTVGFYFDKKKGLAYGIASSGTGFGTSVFSALYTTLAYKYTWKGAVLILGAIMLNCVVCGALYRPLKSRRECHELTTEELKSKGIAYAQKSASVVNVSTSNKTTKDGLHTEYNISSSLPCLTLVGSFYGQVIGSKRGANTQDCLRETNRASHGEHNKGEGSHSELKPRDTHEHVSNNVGSRFLNELSRLLGLGILKEPAFLLVSLVMSLWVCFSTFLTILPHYSLLVGVSNAQASLLVTVLGVTNVAGRLILGFVADRWLSAIWVYTGVLFVGSLSSFLIPFTTTYWCLMAEAAAFGASFGTCLSLRQVVLLDLLGVDKLINAFGLVSMFQGLAYMAGPPIAGKLYDRTQSYREPFLLISAAFALAGLLCIPIARMIKRRKPVQRDSQTL